mmetsp:Transcript_139676/g.243160  ORF Transcript_139676/g.243160 Transcript_139676/m.243160 type:complete len:216 (-) Transcript_139676:168-815(-)
MAGRPGDSGRSGYGARGSFTSDFSKMGTGRSSTIFSAGQSILDEEKYLIDKVFNIVDVDHSGSIDKKELEEMFKLFGVETQFLSSAIQRIMSNVDRDRDEMISPNEFYKLLSQKFEKGDPKKDIDDVFNRIDKKQDRVLDVEEMHSIAQTLGESLDKKEILDMIKTFKTMYQEEMSSKAGGPKAAGDKKESPKTANPNDEKLTPDEWYFIMQQEL